jgi:adenosylmethionine-8-amino-7-oxononanoate aminotransferase
LLFKTIQLPTAYHCSGYKPTLKSSVALLEKTLKKQHNEIAGLVLEPLVQGAAGIYTAPRGYLKAARALCTKYNVLLICDEVAVGFGRTGKMFACEHEGITPDLMAIAKGITGGYLPLAATLTTEKIYDNFKGTFGSCRTFYHGHTYTGNPLACAAALGSLEVFKKEKTLEKLQPKIKLLTQELRQFEKLSVVKDVRQCGLIAAVEIGDFSYEAAMGHRICSVLRKRGIILRPLGNNIVLMPPLSITPKEIRRMIGELYAVLCNWH